MKLSDDLLRELLATFAVEAQEHLQAINRDLLALEKGPGAEKSAELLMAANVFGEDSFERGGFGEGSTDRGLGFGRSNSSRISLILERSRVPVVNLGVLQSLEACFSLSCCSFKASNQSSAGSCLPVVDNECIRKNSRKFNSSKTLSDNSRKSTSLRAVSF